MVHVQQAVYTADLTGEQGDWCWADGEQDEHLSTAGLSAGHEAAADGRLVGCKAAAARRLAGFEVDVSGHPAEKQAAAAAAAGGGLLC